MSMKSGRLKAPYCGRVQGSITVEAAIVVPITLFSILWMVQGGITLYMDTVELIQQREMWETFHPTGQFRKLELLENAMNAVK